MDDKSIESQWCACFNVKAGLMGSGLKTDTEPWHSFHWLSYMWKFITCMTTSGMNVTYKQHTFPMGLQTLKYTMQCHSIDSD